MSSTTAVRGITRVQDADDVTWGTPSDGQVVTFDGATSKLKLAAPTGGGGGGSSTLAADTDVAISSPANNDVLTYETSSSKWKNKPATGGGGGVDVGLTSRWKFDENTGTTAAALGPAGLTATLHGGAGWGAAKLGTSSLSLDGVSGSYASASDATLPTAQKTVCGWIKTSTTPGTAAVFLQYGDGFYLYVTTAGKLEYTSGAGAITSSASVNDNAWHHVGVTDDGIKARLWLDGLAVASEASPADQSLSGTLYIGQQDATTQMYTGLLDDLRIYGRALSQGEMLNLAAGLPYSTPITST